MSNELLAVLFDICKTAAIPLAGYLATVLIDKMKKKIETEEKKAKLEIANQYLAQLNDTVISCVRATNQTYVEVMKAAGMFDKQAQEKAMDKTFAAVKATLSVDALEHLALVTTDLDTLIINKIEAAVNEIK